MDYSKLLEPIVKEIKRAEEKVLNEAEAVCKKVEVELKNAKKLNESLEATRKEREILSVTLKDKLNDQIAKQSEVKNSLVTEAGRYAKLCAELEKSIKKNKSEANDLDTKRAMVEASLGKYKDKERKYSEKVELSDQLGTKLNNDVQLLNEQKKKLDTKEQLLLKKQTDQDKKSLALSELSQKLRVKEDFLRKQEKQKR